LRVQKFGKGEIKLDKVFNNLNGPGRLLGV